MTKPLFFNNLQKIPSTPGCYLMKDAQGVILYIGKAKNLRKRVSSYKQSNDPKTVALLREVVDLETILTDTEVEALLLEAQLIQQYHPKYNIDLQSPGRYAFIKLTKEEYPRFVIARKVSQDGRFFGPFPSGAARNAVLKAINRIFRLCTKKRGQPPFSGSDPFALPQKAAGSDPFVFKKGVDPFLPKPCMRYHLGYCSGSCARAISPSEYRESIKQAETFLHGDFSHLIKETEEKMKEASRDEKFEKAKIYRDQLFALQKIQSQKVSDPKHYDQDIFYYALSSDEMLIQVFHFHKGIISGRKEFSFSLHKMLSAVPQEIFQEFLTVYYRGAKPPHEVIVQEKLPDNAVLEKYLLQLWGRAVKFAVPEKGIKKKLLEMVKKNVVARFGEGGGQVYELKKALHLDAMPYVMNCIDISTLGGTQTVGSLVQFVNGLPRKSGYRKFVIKSFKGMNDFAAISEVVSRFARRVIEDKEKKPDLLVIDGGRGQLSSALKALKKEGLEIPVIGLAKRLEEIYVSWARMPLRLHPTSPALLMLRAIRDESHRFAINFQRKRRN